VQSSAGLEHRNLFLLGAVLLSAGLGLGVRELSGNPALGLALQAFGIALAFTVSERLRAPERARREWLWQRLEALADGDLSACAERPPMSADPCHAALDRATARIAIADAQSGLLRERLAELPGHVSQAMKVVERSAEDQEAAVEETAALLMNINTSIGKITREVEKLARSNEETAASTQQMGTAIEQVAQNSLTLQQTVDSSTTSIHEMGVSIRRVAASSDEVKRVAEETATATTEMDRAIHEVGEHVRGASELTRRVTESAELGSSAVMATIQGIAVIRDQTLGAKQALEGLAERVSEIGEIATVIGGVSDETNLLSLNAAIIAAQAGEHGKAFAVVADQVKTLAQRTSESAKQIEEMIRGVQAESAHAVRTMAAGIESVEDGVSRSRVAGQALETIRATAHDASGQVGEIARAAEEQARNSKYVADAARRVSEHVHQISNAMSEQAQASENLLRNADTSLDMCTQMAQALEEQRATGRYISGNSEAITELIRSIQQNAEAHGQASAAVQQRFAALLEIAQRSSATIPEVARVVEELARSAECREPVDPGDAAGD
jgi:methyl-accepting chemotaxis protein